jgi:hypothetical protein
MVEMDIYRGTMRTIVNYPDKHLVAKTSWGWECLPCAPTKMFFFRNDAREFGVRLTNKINGMLDPNSGIEAKITRIWSHPRKMDE